MFETPEHGRKFAELLREARGRLELRQEDVASASGVSRSTYLRWEAGSATAPYPDHLRAVCRALDIDHRQALVALGYLADDALAPAA